MGAEPVAVGFSPPEALAELAEDLSWPGLFLADVERAAYHRLGLPRAGDLRQVWNRGTRAAYRRAAAGGTQVHKPVEDALQLGGDAVVADGTIIRLWRPATPDARPSVDELVAAVVAAAAT